MKKVFSAYLMFTNHPYPIPAACLNCELFKALRPLTSEIVRLRRAVKTMQRDRLMMPSSEDPGVIEFPAQSPAAQRAAD